MGVAGQIVKQTSEGGYIVAGFTNSSGQGSYDALVIKTDSNGNLQWNKTYGDYGSAWFVTPITPNIAIVHSKIKLHVI